MTLRKGQGDAEDKNVQGFFFIIQDNRIHEGYRMYTPGSRADSSSVDEYSMTSSQMTVINFMCPLISLSLRAMFAPRKLLLLPFGL